jgi:hypothetical protein
MPPIMRRLPLLALLALAALPTATATAAKPFKLSDVMRTYDVKIDLTMESNFAFQADPTGCYGKSEGYAGAGREIIQMSSPKPVRVTLYVPPKGEKGEPYVARKDLKSGFALAGTSKRSGQMTSIVCGESSDTQLSNCTGESQIHDMVDITFYKGTWLLGSGTSNTDDQMPGCRKAQFDWDGAVARTGYILLQSARGKAARSKLKTKGSFSLQAVEKDACDVQYFGTGTCGTTWTYTAHFKRVAKAKHPKH